MWLLDAACFLFILTWGSYNTSNQNFNIHSNQWYDSHRKQLADIDYSNKELVLFSLIHNQIENIFPFFLSETTIDHPKIELYETHNKQNPMEVLLTFIETSVKDGNTIKRKTISEWEINKASYQELLLYIPPIETQQVIDNSTG